MKHFAYLSILILENDFFQAKKTKSHVCHYFETARILLVLIDDLYEQDM